ncbi:PPR repeat [Musa troglodytarum]|uniref:PPR repeat n=1 Tax=Musa troglodytarum TaxID=320322 RepID=A0A9E7FNZ1_9LILI|nr:PPR repeat [Musa troglodytarum]
MIDAPLRHTTRSLVRLIKSISSDTTFAAPSALRAAQQLHSHVRKVGLLSNEFISSALISVCSAIGFVEIARQLFDEIPDAGLVARTAMVRAYVTVDQPAEALQLFRATVLSGLSPDPIALATAISACCQLGSLSMVKMIHGYIIGSGIVIDPFVSTQLIKAYGNHRELDICRYLFDEMPVKTLVTWNTIIHQCLKHGANEMARGIFAKMPERDVVSWNTLMSGCSQVGRCREALALFHEMEFSREKPNKLTLYIVLSACACIGALDTGMWLHAYLGRSGLNSDGSLDHCLIDMYAKCGSIEKALQVFEGARVRSLYSWTSIICGLAMHGQADHALHLFFRMLEVGIQPDDVTLVGVLSACAHGGLVDQGYRFFSSMEEMYDLKPKIEHYGCMIDLLGRVGRLKEAYNMILRMPMRPNAVLWGTMLSACKVHKNVELGEVAAMKLIELDPCDPWPRLMLSRIYAEVSDWGSFMKLRKEMNAVGLRKTPGCSSIEVNGEVHEFLAGDSLHSQIEEIIVLLENIEAQMQVVFIAKSNVKLNMKTFLCILH